MNTNDKTWESTKSNYLQQVERVLTAAKYPSRKSIMEEVCLHLEQRYAELPAEQRVSVSQLRDLARQYGLEAYVVEGKAEDLVYELSHGRPMIVGVAKPTVQDAVAHYEVIVGMNKHSQRVATLDPAEGLRQNSFTGFLTEWQATGRVLLLIIPKRSSVSQSGGSPSPDS